jgi:hypothetical protein
MLSNRSSDQTADSPSSTPSSTNSNPPGQSAQHTACRRSWHAAIQHCLQGSSWGQELSGSLGDLGTFLPLVVSFQGWQAAGPVVCDLLRCNMISPLPSAEACVTVRGCCQVGVLCVPLLTFVCCAMLVPLLSLSRVSGARQTAYY